MLFLNVYYGCLLMFGVRHFVVKAMVFLIDTSLSWPICWVDLAAGSV
jgi:hypothetical protein